MNARGSCLCGNTRFELEGEFESFYLCHCEYCRKDTGSAHASNLFSSTARLKWLSGKETLTSYRLPGSRHARSFCSTCGSALPHVDKHTGLLVVPAGSLDDEVRLKPTAHICMDSKAGWDEDLENVPKIAGLPV